MRTLDPRGDDPGRMRLLTSGRAGPGRTSLPRVVLDTDTYNEIDDQFALVHVLLSPDRVRLEAIYAAPFDNDKSDGPGDGMRKSYDEARRILELFGDAQTPVLEGATEWLDEAKVAKSSPATGDLVQRALAEDAEPLYVVAIGAPTNISNAFMLAPQIIDRVVVIWLGGNSLYWPTAREFNLMQDLYASQVLFDSGAAMVHVPCYNVADHLITTRAEIDQHVKPAGDIGAFLAGRYASYVEDRAGVSKVIWDLAAVAWLLDESWTTSVVTHSPVLTRDMTWSLDKARHLMYEMAEVQRDLVFADLFARLAGHAQSRGRQ